MTLLARNEDDVLDAHLAFHLNAGVDFVVAIDNGSDDGTSEILESYARDGYVDVTHDAGELQQAEWVTRMARRSATEFGADWVVNSDADEFWWPRGGSLKEVLSAVPTNYGSVRGMWRHFAPRPDGDEFFAERMTVRVCNPGSEDNSPYSPRFKTVHRGDPNVEVVHGNHRAVGQSSRRYAAGIRSTSCTSRCGRWSSAERSIFAGGRLRPRSSGRRCTTRTAAAR